MSSNPLVKIKPKNPARKAGKFGTALKILGGLVGIHADSANENVYRMPPDIQKVLADCQSDYIALRKEIEARGESPVSTFHYAYSNVDFYDDELEIQTRALAVYAKMLVHVIAPDIRVNNLAECNEALAKRGFEFSIKLINAQEKDAHPPLNYPPEVSLLLKLNDGQKAYGSVTGDMDIDEVYLSFGNKFFGPVTEKEKFAPGFWAEKFVPNTDLSPQSLMDYPHHRASAFNFTKWGSRRVAGTDNVQEFTDALMGLLEEKGFLTRSAPKAENNLKLGGKKKNLSIR